MVENSGLAELYRGEDPVVEYGGPRTYTIALTKQASLLFTGSMAIDSRRGPLRIQIDSGSVMPTCSLPI